MISKYPMLMNSVFKDYLWGGTRLRDEYGKQTALDPVAESWELSCHRDGLTVIANGEYAGMTLADYTALDREAVLGSAWNGTDGFPILVKLIDAARPLSVQVHPDDAYAAAAENDHGKAEMWYVIAAEPGASLVYGVNRTLSKEEFRKLINENRLEEVLNRVFVKPGDAVFVPPGTLHAIGGGLLIAEVQQSSNATYRVWDYGRKGADGKPRALHIDKSVDVARLYPTPVPAVPGQVSCRDGVHEQVLAECEYFTVRKLILDCAAELESDPLSFRSMTCISGELSVEWKSESLRIHAGETVFIPAAAPRIRLSGKAELLCAGR